MTLNTTIRDLINEELLRYARNRDNAKTEIPWRDWAKHKGSYASEKELVITDDALKHLARTR